MNMIDQIAHAIAEADGSDFRANPQGIDNWQWRRCSRWQTLLTR